MGPFSFARKPVIAVIADQRRGSAGFRVAQGAGQLIGVTTRSNRAQPALTLVPRAMGETITERIGNRLPELLRHLGLSNFMRSLSRTSAGRRTGCAQIGGYQAIAATQ